MYQNNTKKYSDLKYEIKKIHDLTIFFSKILFKMPLSYLEKYFQNGKMVQNSIW